MSVSMRQREIERQPWAGPKCKYDIIKEGTIAVVVVAILTIGLAWIFSSPDEPALTFKGWATSAPENFIVTTVAEIAGTSDSASYGPPYNAGESQAIGPISPAQWPGVTQPIDPVNDFVIIPLKSQQQPQGVMTALQQWDAATPEQQMTWATNLDTAINDPEGADGDPNKVPDGDYGPTTTLTAGLFHMATSGALDGVLPAPGQFFNTNSTKQIMFLGDGSYLDDAGTAFHLQGDLWGMMNETGTFPGQQWLMPFSFWYQLPIFNSADETGFAATLTANGDIYILSIIGVFMLLLIFVPFIPGLRSIPRWIPLHRLIWRAYYRRRTQS